MQHLQIRVKLCVCGNWCDTGQLLLVFLGSLIDSQITSLSCMTIYGISAFMWSFREAIPIPNGQGPHDFTDKIKPLTD